MNLVETAQELEYIPTEQLAQMVNDPSSRIPSFLALSEVQRRNQMKKSYDAQLAAQQKPNTTVADEAVAELTGLAGMSSNQQLSSPMGESPVGGDVPASMMMAEGGLTGYNEGGRSFMDKALDFRDPDGSPNYTKLLGTGLTAASLFNPIGLGVRGIYGAAKLGLPALMKKLGAGYAKRVTEPVGGAAFKLMTPKMRDAYLKRMTAEGAKYSGKRSVPTSALGQKVINRAALTGGLGTVAYASGLEDGDLMGEMDDNKGDVGNQPTSGSGDSVPRATEASIDPYDMARMGFALMGARDTSELAKGLGGIATDIQTRKREEGIRESELEERAARTALYRAQAEGGDEERIIDEINAINKAVEGGVITSSPELVDRITRLFLQLEALRGGTTMTARNPVEENRAN